MIKIYVANLGKYNEGELVGDWLELPVEQDDFDLFLKTIGVDGKTYEEYAIHDYETDLKIDISEYESIERLNELCEALEGKSEHDINILNILLEDESIEKDDIINSVDNILNEAISVNLNDSMVLSEEKNLGYTLIEELFGGVENLDRETLESFFDFEAYGRSQIDSGWIVKDGIAVNYR